MAANQWRSNVLLTFFFARHYSEDGPCRFLQFLLPERALSLERGVCCRGFLLQWMWLQYSGKSRPACSLACSAACPESEFSEDLLSSELSWAGAGQHSFGPGDATCPVCFVRNLWRGGDPSVNSVGMNSEVRSIQQLALSLFCSSNVLCTLS